MHSEHLQLPSHCFRYLPETRDKDSCAHAAVMLVIERVITVTPCLMHTVLQDELRFVAQGRTSSKRLEQLHLRHCHHYQATPQPEHTELFAIAGAQS